MATTNTELLIQFSFLLGLLGIGFVQLGENLYGGSIEPLLNIAESSENLTVGDLSTVRDILKAALIGLPGNSFSERYKFLIDPGACRDPFLYNQNHSYT